MPTQPRIEHSERQHSMAQAIFEAHRQRFAPTSAGHQPSEHQPEDPTQSAQAAQTSPTAEEPQLIDQAVASACQQLGFSASDVECLTAAWRAQSQRLGRFEPTQWPSQPSDFGLAAHPRSPAFAACPRQLGLYAVLPDADWVARMARAGVPTVQLRFKPSHSPEASHGAIQAQVQAQVQAAVAAVQGTKALLFINDHWQAAIEAGAYGVHLGQEDLQALSADDFQRIRQAGLRLGLSTHSYAEIQRADALNPSYIALGAVFPTTLKRMATEPLGLARLHAYAGLLRANTPLVAIGGIAPSHIAAVLASGAGSVAVVRALTGAPDPVAAAQHLRAQIQQHLH